MRKLWEKEYVLRASDFDKYEKIKPSAVLDLFQDAAGQHALEIGVGFSDMIKRGYLWVLTRVKFEIITMPVLYQEVLVKTWPLPPNRLNYKREYSVEDKNGNLLIKGTSEWVVIDSVKRRFLSVPDLYQFKDGFHEEVMFEDKLQKIRDFEINSDCYTVNASFSDLDVNGHVNNTKYANYAIDAINPTADDTIRGFQIDYRKEVMQSTQLNVHYLREDGSLTAKGLNNDGDIMFACKIDFK